MTDIVGSELLSYIKPYVLGWVSAYQFQQVNVTGGTPYAPTPHALYSAHHSGLLDNSQATQFLLTDGTRALTGNLAVAAGVTIDGVDISTLPTFQPTGANPTGLIGMTAVNGSAVTFGRSDSTHAIDPSISPTWSGKHTFTSGVNSITIPDFVNANHTHLSAAQGGTLSLSASVITSGLLALARGGTNADLSATGNAGYYLKQSGAGAAISVAGILDADLPGTIARTSRILTAGAGLTGGGDLSADRTFNVGAGLGLTVNADDVALNLGYAPTWSATHTFTLAPIFSAMTSGSILFAGAAGLLSQDNSKLFWDNTNKRFGVGTAAPAYAVDVQGTESSGDGIGFQVKNNDTSSLSFAIYRMTVGSSLEGGMFFGSKASLDAYGIANGITFRAGTNVQDIGLSVGATVTGGGAGPNVILKSSGYLGINTKGPRRRLDSLDASNPQLRLTYTDNTIYTDLLTDVSGNLTITPTGTIINLNAATIKGNAATQSLFNTVATTVNFAGAATALSLGAGGGTATINNATLALGASAITSSSTTVALLNTTATTVNFAGAASSLSIGAATGTLNLNNSAVSLFGTLLKPNTGYATDIGQIGLKFKSVYAAELWVETLVAQDTLATIGGRILVGPTTQLTADLASGTTSFQTKHNNLTNGDRVYMQANGAFEAIAIASGPSSLSSLTTSLTSWWPLGEASGTRADSVVASANNLTSNNGVTQSAGKVSNAAQFTAASSQYLSIADNASVSTGDIDFTFAAWVYGDTLPNNVGILGKWDAGGTDTEFALFHLSSRFQLTVRNVADTTSTAVVANFAGAPVTATWYYIVCWHDSVANTINIQINDGTVDSTATSGGVRDSTNPLRIGSYSAAADYWNGRIDEVGFWKRVLTAGERTSLYNGGSGHTYTDLAAPGYAYTITRNLDGTGENNWTAGDAVFNTGSTGNGHWDIFSLNSTISLVPDFVYNHDNAGSATPWEAGNYSANYNQSASWTPFSDSANSEIGDSIYFGIQNTTWNNLYFNLTTAAAYTATLVWEFWNGTAWTSFVPTFAGTSGDFKATGWQAFEWTASALTAWAAKAINGQTAYWVRVRISAFTSWTTQPAQSARRVYFNKGRIGPSIVLNKRNSSTWNDISEHMVMGELVGYYGYGASTIGVGIGEYAAGKAHVTIDSTNGYRTFSGLSTVVQQIDVSGNIFIGQQGVAGQDFIRISAGALDLINNATIRIHLASDGSGYLATSNIAWDASGNTTIAGWAISATRISSATVYIDDAGSYISMGTAPPTAYGSNVGLFMEGANSGRLSIYKDASNFLQWDSTKLIWKAANTSLDASGNLTATSATLSGAITATSGAIGGWTVSAAKIAATGIDIISGANAGMAFGATPPTSATAGTGLWLDRTGIYGLAASVLQAKFDAATGAITAGAGTVTIGSAGIGFSNAGSTATKLLWGTTDGGTVPYSEIWHYVSGNDQFGFFDVFSTAAAGKSTLSLRSTNQNATSTANLWLISTGTSLSPSGRGYAIVGGQNFDGLTVGPISSNYPPAATLDVRGNLALSNTTNGQQLGLKTLTELTTIAAAAFTDTAIQFPIGCVAIAASTRVTVVIPTAATYSVKIAPAGSLMDTGLSVAAGTTGRGSAIPMIYNQAAASVRITPSATPSGATGRVRVVLYYYEVTPPTS